MNGTESKVLPLLTVLSTAITSVVVVYLFMGLGYAIELAIVSLAALAAWLRWSFGHYRILLWAKPRRQQSGIP